MTLNVELLEKTMQYILDHPEQHNQGIWIGATIECGTTACFAGWACFLSEEATHRKYEQFVKIGDNRCHIREAAMLLLGLTEGEADYLFKGSNTVEDLQTIVKALANGQDVEDLW